LNNLVIIAVFLIAVAQILTILLTIRRERDIKELAKLVDEQRQRIVELAAWLAGRNAALPLVTKSEREPISEPIANNTKAPESAITPKELPETIQSRTTEDEAATKVLNWQREILAGLRAGLGKGAAPSEPAKAFKWFKEDADEPREIVAGPNGGAAKTPKDLP